MRLHYGALDMLYLKQQVEFLEGAVGQGLVEYAVILLFVAVAVAASVAGCG
jgi:hypothetical protein